MALVVMKSLICKEISILICVVMKYHPQTYGFFRNEENASPMDTDTGISMQNYISIHGHY